MTRTLQSRLKRQRARRQAVFLVFGCTAVVGMVLLVFTLTSPHYNGESSYAGAEAQAAEEAIARPQGRAQAPLSLEAPPLSLGVGGDVTFGLAVADVIASEGTAYPWTDISPLFGAYEIIAVNMEGPLCRDDIPASVQSSVCLRGDASCAAPMADAGIDAVCLANDHIMDYGTAGLEETLNVLRAEGLASFGAGCNLVAAERPLVLEAENGAKVAMVSFCDVSSPAREAGDDTPGIAGLSLERIGETIGAAETDAHYTVVLAHWGEVGSQEITQRQREIAKACVDAGADLVVGYHPHVVQGIELIEGVPVIYSLGNLVFSPESETGKSAIFVGCRFNGGGLTGLEIVPLDVDGGKPVPLSGERAVDVLNYLKTASPGVDFDMSPVTGTANIML